MRIALAVVFGALGACQAFVPKTTRQAQGASITFLVASPLTYSTGAMGVGGFLKHTKLKLYF